MVSQETWLPFLTKPCPITALVTADKTATSISSYAPQNSSGMKTQKFTNVEQFFAEFGANLTSITLIEGVPGIGKTTLMKTLSAKWAAGELLASSCLLFLLFLKDPAVQTITKLQELTEYFAQEASKAEQLCSYLENVNGDNVVFIVDGLDEMDTKLFQCTYFYKLVSGQHLTKARIIVTSRPSAAAFLYDFVDWKIDILGFDKSSRKQYAVEALKNYPQLLVKLQGHFQEHSNIDALCYKPSEMSIITFLCLHQQEELPPTASKMCEQFILLTIVRSLSMTRTDKVIKRIGDLPSSVYKVHQHLEKFAYECLAKNKIIFSVEELPEMCSYDPTHYGLLQSVEHNTGSTAKTRLFYFTHFSVQEYLAASYVASLPPGEVEDLLMKSFLIKSSKNPSGTQLHNMWTLFCGITGGQFVFLRNYLTTHSPNPIKILHLYQCFLEAQDDNMCEVLSTSFDQNTITLKDHQFVHLRTIASLGLILSKCSHRQWKELNLSNSHIGDLGIHLLCQYLQDDKDCEIATIDLTENSLTEVSLPLICYIMKCLRPHTLKLGCNQIASIKGICNTVNTVSTVKVLDLWGDGIKGAGGTEISGMLPVLEELNVSNNYLGDDGAVLLSEGMKLTKTLQKLYINDNEIKAQGTKAIAHALTVNTTLELLNMSSNAIGQDGTVAIAEAITTNKTLTKLYLWDDVTLDEDAAIIIVSNLRLNNVITKMGLPKTLATDNRLINYLDSINVVRNNCHVQELELAFY